MQMMAECVYAATFSMRDPKGMKVQDMFPMLFEETDEPHAPDITEEEAAALQAEMDAWNWNNSQEENPDNSENAAE
jgi:hypothetical protein